MAGINSNIIIDDDQIKRIRLFNKGNFHVWQAMFKDSPDSIKCDFKVSCVDRDRLVKEIDNIKENNPECKQISCIQYVSVGTKDFERYEIPIIERF